MYVELQAINVVCHTAINASGISNGVHEGEYIYLCRLFTPMVLAPALGLGTIAVLEVRYISHYE